MENKKQRKIPSWLYNLLFKFWHFYALKILRIPFILSYTPPPDRKILGMTYAWSMDYAQRVKFGFDSEQRMRELEEQLREANQTIAELSEKGARSGTTKRLRDKKVL